MNIPKESNNMSMTNNNLIIEQRKSIHITNKRMTRLTY